MEAAPRLTFGPELPLKKAVPGLRATHRGPEDGPGSPGEALPGRGGDLKRMLPLRLKMELCMGYGLSCGW